MKEWELMLKIVKVGHCVLLEDIFNHTRICPCYSKLSLMLRGIE